MPAATPRTLSLGCGDYLECPLLESCWPQALHVGVDIVAARRQQFVQADARRLPFAAAFGLILIRHPDLDRLPQNWATIFRALPLCSGGTCLVTTYSVAEMDFVEKNMPLCAHTAMAKNLAPPDLVGHDRYFAYFRRNKCRRIFD